MEGLFLKMQEKLLESELGNANEFYLRLLVAISLKISDFTISIYKGINFIDS